MADDPNVYAYDELYDDMKKEEKKKVESKLNITENTERKVITFILHFLRLLLIRYLLHCIDVERCLMFLFTEKFYLCFV